MDPCIPDLLPIDYSGWNLNKLLLNVGNANAKLAEYNGILTNPAINTAIFLSPFETNEAVLSSKIEGTVTTLDEILKYDASMIEENKDIIEVVNYRSAMRASRMWIERGMPINQSLICEIQKELLHNVRGFNKKPGEIRMEQVWIGAPGTSIDEADYIPPSPTNVPIFLDNLFDFLKNKEIDPLLQTAILHAQFEIIHPFNDGNGRTGRILIPLLLWERGKLPAPTFYISEFLEKNRNEYSKRLLEITQKGEWENWVYFFLRAIENQAATNSERALKIIDLYNDSKKIIIENGSKTCIVCLDSIFTSPLFTSKQFRDVNNLNSQTANRVLHLYSNLNLVTMIKKGSGRAPDYYAFLPLLDIIKE